MTKFILDVNKSINYEDSLETMLSAYDTKSDETFMYVKNVLNNWTDPASQAFEPILLKNEETAKEIKKSLKEYLKNASRFSNTIRSLFLTKDYTLDDLRIKYDTIYLTSSCTNANTVMRNLSDAVSLFASLTVPSGFYMLGSINSGYNMTNSAKNNMIRVHNDLVEIKTKIENLLVNTETTHRTINLVFEDRKVTSFVWKLLPPDVPVVPERLDAIGSATVGAAVSATATQAVLQGSMEGVHSSSTQSTTAEQAVLGSMENNEITYADNSTTAPEIVLRNEELNQIAPETEKTSYVSETIAPEENNEITSENSTATIEDVEIVKEEDNKIDIKNDTTNFETTIEKNEDDGISTSNDTAAFNANQVVSNESDLSISTDSASMNVGTLNTMNSDISINNDSASINPINTEVIPSVQNHD